MFMKSLIVIYFHILFEIFIIIIEFKMLSLSLIVIKFVYSKLGLKREKL